MAIEKVPGQKGVNWSNIAVGECELLCCARSDGSILTFVCATGAIMNMVLYMPMFYRVFVC